MKSNPNPTKPVTRHRAAVFAIGSPHEQEKEGDIMEEDDGKEEPEKETDEMEGTEEERAEAEGRRRRRKPRSPHVAFAKETVAASKNSRRTLPGFFL